MLTFSPDPLDDALTRQALLASAALHDELADHLNERLYVLGPHASPEAVLSVARQVLEEHVGPLANLLGDSIVAAYVTGAARFADRLPGGMFPDEPLPGTTWTWDGSPVWLPAIGNAAEDLARRRLVMKPDYEQLSAEARQQAFTVAHVTSQGTLDKIRNAIIDAVGDGKSFPEFREDVIDAVGHSPIGPGHLDNVFRTNVASAMNRGQEEVWAQPVIRERFPYVLAEGVDDSRQTALCHAINHGGLDGTGIYRADDPVWQHFKAPRHHRCRCSCTYLTVEDAAARGVKSARRWLETGEDPQDFVPWPDVELPAGWVSAGPVAMSVRHAPKGGTQIDGKEYSGGEFLPGKATAEIAASQTAGERDDGYTAGSEGDNMFESSRQIYAGEHKGKEPWQLTRKEFARAGAEEAAAEKVRRKLPLNAEAVYYHVVPAGYQDGSPIYSGRDYEQEMGQDLPDKWGDDWPDYKDSDEFGRVSLFDSLAEAEDYKDEHGGKGARILAIRFQNGADLGRGPEGYAYADRVWPSDILGETSHKDEVKKAVARGDEVPADVLADYPDLS